ncbi:hypothetical protein AJ87_37735 [Rhizobium yanglingense]|nr:hypothetical protein AJ87_37735 [Rhizobium yanglingense]
MQEAAAVFAATDQSRPVKHMWTREDDIRGGYYRPMYLHRMRGAIDKNGQIVAWDQTIVGQSIMGKATSTRLPSRVRPISPTTWQTCA